MNTVVKGILDQIIALSDEQRAELDAALIKGSWSEADEKEWKELCAKARATAKAKKITSRDVDAMIEEMRYGKARR